MNANMPRWIISSCIKHFYTNRGSYEYRIEGENRPTDGLQSWCEFRCFGPHIKETTKNIFVATITINLLLQQLLNDADMYRLHAMSGHFMSKFGPIEVRKYDDASNSDVLTNDGSRVGCLQIKTPVDLMQLGTAEHFIRASLQGRYEMDFEE